MVIVFIAMCWALMGILSFAYDWHQDLDMHVDDMIAIVILGSISGAVGMLCVLLSLIPSQKFVIKKRKLKE